MRGLWVIWGAVALIAVGCGSEGDDLFGTAGTAGGGGETGSSSSSSSNGTGGSTEDCLNSSDDDNNGHIDCQDPACSVDYECVPIPPAGWDGVGYLSGLTAADCPAAMDIGLDLHEQSELSAPPASCSCTCSGAGSVQCTVQLTCWDSQGCIGNAQPMEAAATCMPYPFFGGNFSCSAGPPIVQPGTCTVGDIDVNVPPVSWPSTKSLCLAEQGGFCDAANVCVPRKPANASGPCIARAGQHACPAGYAQKSVYYDGTFSDNRGCGACSCSSTPTGAACGCTGSNCGAALFTQPGCQGGFLALIPTTGACINGSTTEPLLEIRTANVQVTNPGSCPPGSASPTGDVTYNQGTITVCCDL